MKISEFQKIIEDYCETLIIPTNYEEHIKFKKVFDYKWEKELNSLEINDVLTYNRFDNNFGDIKIKFKEIDEMIFEYRDKNTIRIYLFFTIEYNLLDKLKTLNEGDVINIGSEVKGISSRNSNSFHQIINHNIVVNFKITSFDIINKIDPNIEFEKLENSLKKTE